MNPTGRMPAEVARHLSSLSPATRRTYSRFIADYYKIARCRLSAVTRASVVRYLTYLAVERHVSAAYQNLALSSIAWLVRVTDQSTDLSGLVAKRAKRWPASASDAEARTILSHLRGDAHTVVALVYGSGLTLAEALSLRVDDLDTVTKRITINGRTTVMPATLAQRLALYADLSPDGRLFDVSALTIHRSIHRANLAAGLTRPIGTRELRFGFAVRLLEQGRSIIKVKELMGYKTLNTLLKLQRAGGDKP